MATMVRPEVWLVPGGRVPLAPALALAGAVVALEVLIAHAVLQGAMTGVQWPHMYPHAFVAAPFVQPA